MKYKKTLDYLYTQLPMFQRKGAAAYKADLNNTINLCKAFGKPETKFKSIHLAGTNGKGSCSHMMSSVLQEKGLKVGLYTSPHLKDFRERIKINGKMVNKDYVIDFVENNKDIFNSIQPSFFEITFIMAMDYFYKQNIDIAVVETGMGGRLDSTNVINSVLSVITNIGMDHTQFLGNTLEKIATEKAGIIKKNIPCLIGKKQKETTEVFKNKAAELNSKLFFAEDLFSIDSIRESIDKKCFDIKSSNTLFKNLCIDFTGNYQEENLLTVLSACEILNREKILRIDKEEIYKGLSNAKENTGFFGRWSILNKKPLTVCDTAHNKEGLQYVINQINQQSFNKLHIIIGFVNDKNVKNILPMFPKNADYYFCRADIPRAMNGDELKEIAKDSGLIGENHGSVKNAIKAANKNANPDDMIFIGGSTFVIAEV